ALSKANAGHRSVHDRPPDDSTEEAGRASHRRADFLLPVDIQQSRGILLLVLNRSVYAISKSRSPPGNTRSAGAEDARFDGAAARLRDRPAHPAGLRRAAAVEPGNALPRAAAPRAARLDRFRVGRVGKQPQGQVLLSDPRRTQAAPRGSG